MFAHQLYKNICAQIESVTCVSEGGATAMHLQQILGGAHFHLRQPIETHHLLTVAHPDHLTSLRILSRCKRDIETSEHLWLY